MMYYVEFRIVHDVYYVEYSMAMLADICYTTSHEIHINVFACVLYCGDGVPRNVHILIYP